MASTKRKPPEMHSGGFDITNPQHRIAAINRLTTMGLSLPSHLVREGGSWYPEAHENVAATARESGLSLHTAAGVTAALSPASDWGSHNIPAVSQAAGLRKKDWSTIMRLHGESVADLHRRRAAGTATSTERPVKHPGISDLLSERGATSLSQATVPNLIRAHRMVVGGEHPLDVLTRQTSPKTRAFYTGIAEPRHRGREIPIDYRMYDLIANEMRPQNTERKIDVGSYARASMGKTRYEHAEDIVGEVGRTMRLLGGRRFGGASSPLGAQATLWMGGKHHELHMPGSKASRQRPGERFSGPARRGQAYTDEHGNLISY